jgi:septum formation topological specificity factor MinE
MTISIRSIGILVSLFFVLGTGVVSAQKKLIEKSQRKKPDWVNAVMSNYIIMSARAITLEEAKRQIIPNIRKEIINSVAVYVQSSNTSTLINKNDNGMISTVEQFVMESHSESADIPMIKDLSLSHADDFYWEKFKDKQSGEVTCVYHVKYPFSQAKRQKIVQAFNEQDARMEVLLKKVQSERETLSTTKQLYDNLNTLAKLRKYFPDNRKEMADLEYKFYSDLLQNIHIDVLEKSTQKIQFAVVSNNRKMRISEDIKLSSSFGIKMNPLTENKGTYTLEYSDEGSLKYGEKYIEIELFIKNKKLYKKLILNSTEKTSKITSVRNIHAVFEREAEQLNLVSVQLGVDANISEPIHLKTLNIEWESTGTHYSIPFNRTITQSGHNTFQQNPRISINNLNIRTAEPYVSGNLTYYVEQQKKSFSFYYIDFKYTFRNKEQFKQPERSAGQK